MSLCVFESAATVVSNTLAVPFFQMTIPSFRTLAVVGTAGLTTDDYPLSDKVLCRADTTLLCLLIRNSRAYGHSWSIWPKVSKRPHHISQRWSLGGTEPPLAHLSSYRFLSIPYLAVAKIARSSAYAISEIVASPTRSPQGKTQKKYSRPPD